jgi:hypothetical protein
MESTFFLRVVALRRGKLRPVEFCLRPGEIGLSLFAQSSEVSAQAVLEAVREAGKHGELAVALLPRDDLRHLGLKLIPTLGGTPAAEVNALHHEARLPWLRRLWLALIRKPTHEYFNEQFSRYLYEMARLVE